MGSVRITTQGGKGMKFKEMFCGNYEDEDKYVPNLFQRYKNTFSSFKENKKFCSCGLMSYCLFHYIYPSDKEKSKFASLRKEVNDGS